MRSCSGKGATPASGATKPRTAVRSDFGDMSGIAAPTAADCCTAQEGIEPWEQQASQSLPPAMVWSPQVWVIESPMLDPRVAAYVSAGLWSIVTGRVLRVRRSIQRCGHPRP